MWCLNAISFTLQGPSRVRLNGDDKFYLCEGRVLCFRLNGGDKFYLCEGRVLCEYDYEEQNLITSIQRGYNAMSHMRKHSHGGALGGGSGGFGGSGYGKQRGNMHS